MKVVSLILLGLMLRKDAAKEYVRFWESDSEISELLARSLELERLREDGAEKKEGVQYRQSRFIVGHLREDIGTTCLAKSLSQRRAQPSI